MRQRRRPFWRRPAVVGLLLLLGLNLAVAMAFTLPRRLAGHTLEARLTRLRTEVEAQRAEAERLKKRRQLLIDNARDTRRLLGHLVGQREATLVPLLAELERHASELGVAMGPRALKPEEVKGTPLTRYEIRLPIDGSYARLVGFLRRLEHSESFLTIDRVRLGQKDERNLGRMTLDVTVSAYFSDAPAGAGTSAGKHGR